MKHHIVCLKLESNERRSDFCLFDWWVVVRRRICITHDSYERLGVTAMIHRHAHTYTESAAHLYEVAPVCRGPITVLTTLGR